MNHPSQRLIGRPQKTRSTTGTYLVEVVFAAGVSMVFLGGVLGITSSLYKAGTQNQNQIMATNMAQEVIDNARNSTFGKLQGFLNGQTSVTQNIELYDYPADPANSMFPRPLLRNTSSGSGMTYESITLENQFQGTVTETLTDLAPGSTTNGLIGVEVDIVWNDSTGPHTYTVKTEISQTGVHS